MTVREFMLKKFPTNEYIDCPVPTHYWETIQEYANEYYESKLKENSEHVKREKIAFAVEQLKDCYLNGRMWSTQAMEIIDDKISELEKLKQ